MHRVRRVHGTLPLRGRRDLENEGSCLAPSAIAVPQRLLLFAVYEGTSCEIMHPVTRPVGRPLKKPKSLLTGCVGVDKYTVKDLGGWSVVSVVENHFTGDVSEVHRRAMELIANSA